MNKILQLPLRIGNHIICAPGPLFFIYLLLLGSSLFFLIDMLITEKKTEAKTITEKTITEKPVEKVEPELIVPGFTFIKFSGGGNDAVNTLNHWRQTNYDKHIISFSEVYDGFIIRWSPNPGNSRQVFVAQYSSEPCSHLSFMKLIQDEYYNHEIIDISSEIRGYVFLLQEKLEPYEPSKE